MADWQRGRLAENVSDGDTAMLDRHDHPWLQPERIVSASPREVWHLPALRPAHVVLEDHAGWPIECPVCEQVDRWRPRRATGHLQPDSFTCSHLMRDEDGRPVRRIATVAAEQVGGYLDLTSLIDSAA